MEKRDTWEVWGKWQRQSQLLKKYNKTMNKIEKCYYQYCLHQKYINKKESPFLMKNSTGQLKRNIQVQVHLRGNCRFGYRPPQWSVLQWSESYLFVGGGSCLQFVKNATSEKCIKAKHNERRSACISDFRASYCYTNWCLSHKILRGKGAK